MIDAVPLAPSRSGAATRRHRIVNGIVHRFARTIARRKQCGWQCLTWDQKVGLFRKEPFSETDIEETRNNLGGIQLARVDYSALQKLETPVIHVDRF